MLKIEGRMKRPEYVAAAVSACRKARAGRPYDEKTLRAVFSRSGFTDGYLTGRRDRTMFGARTREDVAGAGEVLAPLAALYRQETPLVPVNMFLTVNEGFSDLSVTDGVRTVAVRGPGAEPAVTRPLDEERARQWLAKTGGTQYYVNEISTHIAPGLSLSAAALKGMRRKALGALEDERGMAPDIPRHCFAFVSPKSRTRCGPTPLWARFARAEQMTDTEKLARIILPVRELTAELTERYGEKLTAELPALLFPEDEPALEAALGPLAAAGLREVWTDNIYGIELGKRLGLTVRGGFGLNVLNSEAVDLYARQHLASLTVSFELPMAAIKALSGDISLGLAAYGHLPLMRFRACPVRAGIGCARCGGDGALTDRKGVRFPVECEGKRSASLLNSVPLHMAGRDDPLDWRLIWFTRETAADCRRVIGEFLTGNPSPLPRTGGLYYRTLL